MRRVPHFPRVSGCTLLRQNSRKLYGKPALVSSLSRLAGLLGGGGSPERTGLVPSMRLLPLVGRPENSREFLGVGKPSGNPRLTCAGGAALR